MLTSATTVATQGIEIHVVTADFFYDPARAGVRASLEAVDVMVAVEQPRADCGHVAALTQQCGRCLRWCCPECYLPWTALSCSDCRAEARAARAAAAAVAAPETPARPRPAPGVDVGVDAPAASRPCRGRGGARPASGSHRHREPSDVRTLADRVAALERRLRELQPGS